jgi:hypothetical protein
LLENNFPEFEEKLKIKQSGPYHPENSVGVNGAMTGIHEYKGEDILRYKKDKCFPVEAEIK